MWRATGRRMCARRQNSESETLGCVSRWRNRAALDVDLQHRASADVPPSGGEGHRGAGVALGGSLDHVILLLAAYAGDASVVLYADEQPSAVGVGEGAEGAGDLLTVADFELEVLPLVFAFCDQGFEGVHVHFN